MDRARSFEFVAQFPRRTVEEVEYRDAVYDKQVLLNESWASYCTRSGYAADRQSEDHVKWVTETWAEYEQRVILRSQALDAYFDKQAHLQSAMDLKAQERLQQSKNCVQHLVALSNAAAAKRHQPIHTLYVDFEERQELKMRAERLDVEEKELIARKILGELEHSDRKNIELLFAFEFEAVLAALERRRREKEEEEQRIADEQRRKAEELRRLEEQKKRDAEAAEKARREAEEEAKRAERKRREEERKNKAKAEREARAKQTREQEAEQPAEAPAAAPAPVPQVTEEPVVPKEQPPAPVEEPVKKIVSQFKTIEESAKSAVHTLFAQASTILRGEYGDDVYVARVSKGTAGKSYVVSHNGSTILLRGADGLPHHLLGCTLTRPECITIASQKLHKSHQFTSSVDTFVQNRCELIGNVREQDSACPYREGVEKVDETLLLIPVDHPRLRSGAPYVVGVTRAGANSIQPEEVLAIAEFVLDQVAPVFTKITEKQAIIDLAQQALDWLSVTTTCKNCYLALADNPADPQVLEYVATSAAQRFLIGKRHTRAEEGAGVGVSFTLMDEAKKLGQPIVAHVANVADKTTNKINSNSLLLLGDQSASGALLLCPVLKPSQTGGGGVFGVIYADSVGSAGSSGKEFTKGDEDIVRTTAALLAELIDVGPEGPQDSAGLRLSIEKELLGDDDCAESPIRFLKHVWLRVNTDISKITSGQLLELAKYHHPPPIIPVTITATMLVALGCQPKSVEQWEDSRKKIKTSLLEKIIAFDPTDSHRRKKAYFTRARKITKNYSAHDVFVRGSYPASCFFTWTFVTILLRRSADALRKSIKALNADNSSFSIPLEFLARMPSNDDAQDDDDTSVAGTIDGDDMETVAEEDPVAEGEAD